MTQFPDVDVVVATRDRAELLRTAITSILASNYAGSIRVLVVYDQSIQVIALQDDVGLGVDGDQRAITVLTNSRTPGLAGARNSGLLAAEAEFVAFCDDDDTWLPEKLRAQVAALHHTPTAEFICCGIEVEYDGETHPRVLDQTSITIADLIRDRIAELHPSTFLMKRKAVIDGFGLVAEDIPGGYGEDYEFLLRAARNHPIVNVPTVGVHVLWSQASYFTARWSTIRTALAWLLERNPEFAESSAGEARVLGQIAFATAADHERRAAVSWAGRALRRRPTEPRAYLALGVAAGVLSPDWVLRQLHRSGRGL